MKYYGKKISMILLACIIFFQSISLSAYAENPDVVAQSAIVINQKTGEVLFEKDPDTLRVPASMTKIMTAYIVFEEIEKGTLKKDTMISISPNVARLSTNLNYPMAVALQQNASYSVDTLLQLIMIPSASASCIAVAEHISGSEEAFVRRMNQTAQRMGLNANFKNSHGAQPHYITARSVAILIKNFVDKYPEILKYTSLESVSFRGKTYNNTNQLLSSYEYEGANGFKTGTIPSAGFCLSSSAERNGDLLIGVVMKSNNNDNRHNDSIKILNYGFNELKSRNSAFNDAKIEFSQIQDEIRLNSEYEIKAIPTNLKRKMPASVILKANGETIKKENIILENNKPISMKYFINNPGAYYSAKLELQVKLNDSFKKVINKDISISQEKPALFRDINGSPLEDEILELNKKGIVSGYDNGYFGIKDGVSRGQFVTILGRITEDLGIDTINEGINEFSDVNKNQYYNKYVSWVSEKGIANGSGKKFYPNTIINREETATILANYIEHYIKIESDTELKLNDESEISIWARESIDKVLEKEIMRVKENNKFMPKDKVLRENLVEIISKLYELLELEI